MKGFQSHGKDIEREILLKLDKDRDLIKVCNLNKYFINKVCDDQFFKRRLASTRPNTLKYKDLENSTTNFKKLSWKQYFLQVIYYISKLKEDFKYDYIDGNFKNQFYIFSNSKDNNNLLYNSSSFGEITLVKEALKQGANMIYEDDYGEYIALQIASENGHLEVVKYLLEYGIRINSDFNYNIYEALSGASRYGHIEIIDYIFNKYPEIIADNIESVLNQASKNGEIPVIQYLVKNNYDISPYIENAISFARSNGLKDTMRYLRNLKN